MSSPVAQGLFDEPDPGSTWCGPRFLDAEELEAAAPLPPPPAPAPRVARAPLPPPAPSSAELAERVDLLPAPADRPTPRQLAITIVASLGLVVASAFVSQYLFTYLFTGHW